MAWHIDKGALAGDIVFMDNVSVHKVDGIEEAIEARGAIPFYLPAYSPDLNPIEQLFAKLKALLRKVAAYTLQESCLHRQKPLQDCSLVPRPNLPSRMRRIPCKFRLWSS